MKYYFVDSMGSFVSIAGDSRLLKNIYLLNINTCNICGCRKVSISLKTGSYRAVARPLDTAHGHPVLVFDREGVLHVPLTVAAKEVTERTSSKTARTYLNSVLPFFTWMETDEWQVRAGNRWECPPEQIRQAVGDFLIQKLRCRVRPHKYGFQVVEVTQESRNTSGSFYRP